MFRHIKAHVQCVYTSLLMANHWSVPVLDVNSVNYLTLIARTVYVLIAIHIELTISSSRRFRLLLLHIIYISLLGQ